MPIQLFFVLFVTVGLTTTARCDEDTSIKYRAYAVMMGTRPTDDRYALTDFPVGLAAWMYDYNNAQPERVLTKDEMLDDITLYWLTNTATALPVDVRRGYASPLTTI